MHYKPGWLIPGRIIAKIFLCNILFIEKWLSGQTKWNEISYHDTKIKKTGSQKMLFDLLFIWKFHATILEVNIFIVAQIV